MGSLRWRLHRARAAFRQPPWQEPGHFYSPLTNDGDITRALAETSAHSAVDLRADAQLALAEQLAPRWRDLPLDGRWVPNDYYNLADASVLSGFIGQLAPQRVVEIGSGYSSAVVLDTCDRLALDTTLTFVEPYPERLLGLLSDSDRARVTIREEPVQDTPIEVFTQLDSGDVLIIDSTHVAKAGSDVEHLLFRVLPRLDKGVVVHIHDMFWPWQYPQSWLRERRDWNELYLVHAFLAYNEAWQVELFSDWLWQEHPERVSAWLPSAAGERPGSLWIRRVG
jgi:predicted O-methyltransferase YrrM